MKSHPAKAAAAGDSTIHKMKSFGVRSAFRFLAVVADRITNASMILLAAFSRGVEFLYVRIEDSPVFIQLPG